MKIIVWLWNPWDKYKETRHNIWFMFIEYLKSKYGFDDFKDSKFKALISEGIFNWEKTILVKPMTYMNLSWESVALIMNFYKLNLEEDLLVVFDDISMEFWKLRFRETWTDGWHNGIKSIIKSFWSKDFKRIKIWIWKDQNYETSDWVLSKFKKDEILEINDIIIPEAIKLLKEKFI